MKTKSGKPLTMSGWMTELGDSTYLSELSIPGTHDACTYASSVPYVACQTQPLTEQFNRGIRCFDLRCRHFENRLALHHSSWYLDQDLPAVLATLKSCLEAHPKETIVIFVKAESDEKAHATSPQTYEKTFNDIANGFLSLIHTDQSIPKLGDVRGKLVLLRRFEAAGALGINLWNSKGIDPKDKSKDRWGFVDDCADFTVNISPNQTFRVQDEYTLNAFSGASVKWKLVKALLDETKKTGPSQDTWWINFASAVGITPFLNDPDAVARGVNKELRQILDREPSRFIGTVMMDFAFNQDHLVSKIIESNF
jgi:1-phosphatidylinositol phosphodiesterase